MVFLLPKVKSFGEEFGGSLGGGLGRGFSEGIQEKEKEKSEFRKLSEQARLRQETDTAKIKAKQDMVNSLFGGNQFQQNTGETLRGDQNQIDNELGFPPGFDASKFSDEDILRATAAEPALGNALAKAKDVALRENREKSALQRKEFSEERSYHTQFSKPAEEKVNLLRNTLPKQEAALNYARQAIESGEVGAFTMNHLADLMGADSLRNSKGSQLVLAAKEQLLPTLGRISAKAQNQYMEKRMSSMIPQVGAQDEANLTMQEMLEGEAEIDRAYVTEFDRLVAKDTEEHKFTKKDIEKRARDAVKYKEKEIGKRTAYRMKEIEEESEGLSSLKSKVGKNVIQGTPLTLSMANLYIKKFGENAQDVAKKNGYSIPTREELMIFEQRPEQYRETL